MLKSNNNNVNNNSKKEETDANLNSSPLTPVQNCSKLQYNINKHNLQVLLKGYHGEVAGDPPEGNWNQEEVAFQGLGLLRIVLDIYTDVLYKGEGARPCINFAVDMNKYNGLLKLKELINIIRDQVITHFMIPLDNGASRMYSIEAEYTKGKLWLGYDGIQIESDDKGSYYFITFAD